MSSPITSSLIWLRTTTLICLLALTASCADLTAVREWSQTSLEAAQYNELVTTYGSMPKRLKRYDPAGPWDDLIDQRAQQAEALRRLLGVVTDYMAALAVLSSDGVVEYGEETQALTQTLGKLNANVSTQTLGAVGSLIETLLEANARAYRSAQVTTLIERANAPLQTMLQGELRQIIDLDFRRDLQTERAYLDRYYDQAAQTGAPSAAAKLALAEWKEWRLERNAQRLAAIDAYLHVLDQIAAGHEQLYAQRNRLNAKTLIRDMLSLSIALRKQIKILARS